MPIMSFTGTQAECDAYVAQMLDAYPVCGYSTNFNWPPGRKAANGMPLKENAPTNHGDGRWTVRGSRLASCD